MMTTIDKGYMCLSPQYRLITDVLAFTYLSFSCSVKYKDRVCPIFTKAESWSRFFPTKSRAPVWSQANNWKTKRLN